jgi:PAS domain S-box-containing protein
MEYIQQAMQSTAVVSFEWLHKRRDATLVPCEVTLTRISVGNEEQLLVCVRDITERQKHQHEVERLLKEQQALFDAAPVGIFYTGDGTIVRANRQMGLLYGWPDGSAVGRRSAEIHTSEESLKAFGALVGAQLAKGEAVSEAWPQRRADGSEFMAQISGQAISMEGYQIASVWTIEDITERRQAEARLRDQFAFQQALVDTIPYPVFYKGADSRFLGANRAYEDTFGIRREDIIGKRALDLDYLPEADREAYQKEDEEIIANSGTVQKELSMSFADGRIHDTLYYVAGFRREDGSPGGLVGTFIDVSDRKKVEDLERFNRLALGREQRIVELKREINALAAEFGRGAPYAAPDEVEAAGPQEEAASAVGTADAAAMIKQEFAELVQREQLKELFDGFCASVGIAAAIIDLDANVLASSRWQRVCTDFHRVNAKSCANCIESDTGLASKLEEGRDFTMYRCKNGMTDCAAPIVIDGHHVANVFIGQFHLQKPDPVFFRKQAAEFGFDADRYVAAVEEAPVMAEDKLPHILGFLARFARLIGAFAIGQRHALLAEQQSAALAVTAWNERVAALSLAEDADKARQELLVYQEQLEKIFVERTARLEQIDRAAQADPEGGGSA